MTPKVVDKKEKRKAILNAAMKVFARQGVSNTKIDDIALEAGIGKGTFYEYFKSKSEIISEAFQHLMEQIESEVAKKLYKIPDPVEKIRCLIITWIEVLEKSHIETMEIMLDFWAEGIRHKDYQKEVLFDLKKMYDEYRVFIAAMLVEGIRNKQIKNIDPGITASFILGALDGMMIQWFMDKSIFELSEAAETVCDIIFEGIKVK